ncbi:unnamed protein product [Pipistrellus nathusii]|uniref:Maturase K n=1 Tax=Pipistrellus nathusii TaxID=59473 RepID=A0ABN9ZXE6_PIPNA
MLNNFYEKYHFLKQTKMKKALSYIFANMWFNRRELNSHICFCIQSISTNHVVLKNSSVHLEKDIKKTAWMLSILPRAQGFPQITFENRCSSLISLLYIKDTGSQGD